jgi:hypothetical protein
MRLIITNGDDAVERLREAEIEAEFLPWRDALHEGPVPGGLLLEALSLIRAQFLASELGLRLTDVMRQFAERDAMARNHGQYDRVELWFEHDLYDQLQLIQLLDYFRSEKRTRGLFLVQSEHYLAMQTSDRLHDLAKTARPVEEPDFELGQCVWAAFTAPTPERLSAQTAAGAFRLPHLAPALRRLLQELPHISSGLSLTEERILNNLSRGARLVKELFEQTQAEESARFLGDTFFFRRLSHLASAPQPLLAGFDLPSATPVAPDPRFNAHRVRLTETGRSALAGRFDHATENAIDRWLGGTHLTAKQLWRRDRNGQLARASGA